MDRIYHLRFNADEKDMLQSIQALGNAVTVLSKHHESFLQTTADSKEVLKSDLCSYGFAKRKATFCVASTLKIAELSSFRELCVLYDIAHC